MNKKKSEFDFSISFAGAQRSIAEELSNLLVSKGFNVFYDESYPSRLIGKRLDIEFEWIFGSGTGFFVPIVSLDYVERHWPQLEWSIARKESTIRDYEFILPLRLDNTRLIGLPDHVGYIDLRKNNLLEVVNILEEKFNDVHPEITRGVKITRWVATFGVLIEDIISRETLPIDMQIDYPHLCDWLEKDIMDRVVKSGYRDSKFVEASSRNGETLSVRIGFSWDPSRSPLFFGDLDWWDVLEVIPYNQIYSNHCK